VHFGAAIAAFFLRCLPDNPSYYGKISDRLPASATQSHSPAAPTPTLRYPRTPPVTRTWQASWIWPRDRREPNLHLLVRKDVVCERRPDRAQLVIAIESAAQVYLNDVEIGRTAANAYPGQHYYETFDCQHALVAGINRLAVVARYIGIPSSASIPKDPGLLCELLLESDGRTRSIGSDATWSCLVLDAWIGRQRRSEWLNLDLIEVLDHRRLPAGFPCVPDLSGFSGPEALPWPGVRFPGLEPRPFAKTTLGDDARLTLLRAGSVVDRSGDEPIPALAMSHETIVDASFDWDDAGHGVIAQRPHGEAFSLLFAFDGYWNGRLVLDVSAPTGAVIDLAWHEALVDGRFDVRTSRVYTADRHILAAGRQRIEPEDWLCGRFLQVTFRHITAPIHVHALRFRREDYPLHQRLNVTASDPRLERIVAISLEAVRRCMHDNIMDCPWRERRQWIGDAQRIALINHLAFGDRALVRAVLRQHVHLQDASGRMWVCVPIWEEFPTQSMEWLRAVLEYDHFTGDHSLLADVFDNMELLHRWFLRHRDDDGLLFITARPIVNWMDNPYGRIRPHQFDTPYLAQNLRYLLFLDDVATCFRRVDRAADAAQVDALRHTLAQRIRTCFHDPDSGLLRDSARTTVPFTVSEMGHALAIVSGVVVGDAAHDLWHRFTAFRQQRPQDVIAASPFGAYHTHQALAQLGLDDAIVTDILTRWGPMVDAGAMTTWERFAEDTSGAICTHGSHCHGWAGIPVIALIGLLGLDGRQPGTARREQIGGVAWIAAELT